MRTGGQESDNGDSAADRQAEVSSGQVLLRASSDRVHGQRHRRSVSLCQPSDHCYKIVYMVSDICTAQLSTAA